MALAETCRALVTEARRYDKGAVIKGKAEKHAARDLVRRGLANLNKSETRLTLTPAGRWAFSQSK